MQTLLTNLRTMITDTRLHERVQVVRWFGDWPFCPGCNQSCTGSYDGHVCCTRCQAVVT